MDRLLRLQQSVDQHGDFLKAVVRRQNSFSENKEDGVNTVFVYSALCVCIQERRKERERDRLTLCNYNTETKSCLGFKIPNTYSD